MAKLTFYGATEAVTGSAYHLECERATILLECGLVQGNYEEEQANKKALPLSGRVQPGRSHCVAQSQIQQSAHVFACIAVFANHGGIHGSQ